MELLGVPVGGLDGVVGLGGVWSWGGGRGNGGVRCPFWLIRLKNRGRFLVYLAVQSTTRAIYLFSRNGHLRLG